MMLKETRFSRAKEEKGSKIVSTKVFPFHTYHKKKTEKKRKKLQKKFGREKIREC